MKPANPDKAFVSQREWAERLGISVHTFREWRAQGRIPPCLGLPGWPKWSAETVETTTRQLLTGGQGKYSRARHKRREAHAPKREDSDFWDLRLPGIPESPYVTLEEAALYRRCQLPDGSADLEGMRAWCDHHHVKIYNDGLISRRELRIEIERMKNPPPWMKRREKSGY